jgi:hypothetical protein
MDRKSFKAVLLKNDAALGFCRRGAATTVPAVSNTNHPNKAIRFPDFQKVFHTIYKCFVSGDGRSEPVAVVHRDFAASITETRRTVISDHSSTTKWRPSTNA